MTSSSERGIVTLAEWRKAKGFSQNQLATQLSAALGRAVRQANVWWWENGVMPGADVAEAIRIVTDGEVTASSFGRSCPSV